MLFVLLKRKERFLMAYINIVIVILNCPLKEVFLCRNFHLRPRKVSVVRRCPLRTCPLHRGFLIRILYETNLFLKKCQLEGGVRYREVSL